MPLQSSYRGQYVDIYTLSLKNEKSIAIGNANMNARGDILGKNGKVKKKREDIIKAYYEANPKAVTKINLRKQSNKLFDIEDKVAKEIDKPIIEPKVQADSSSIVRQVKPETIKPDLTNVKPIDFGGGLVNAGTAEDDTTDEKEI